MIQIDWNPVAHLGPVPINWYGLGWAAAFLAGWWLARRSAAAYRLAHAEIDDAVIWILGGAFVGARLYYVAQNEPGWYLANPLHILAVWEGGLAFFGGLFGAMAAAYVYARRADVSSARLSDLFAPVVPIAAAIGRIPCFFDGMDYGTPTTLPWGVVYANPNSYAPQDGVPRHPDQVYELLGDLAIAAVLLKMRGRLPDGVLFLMYMVLFSVLRFFLFFVRGNVAPIAWGLKNAQWTALVILVVVVPVMIMRLRSSVHSVSGRASGRRLAGR